MEFTLTRSNDWKFEEQIKISSLQELQALQEKYGYQLIINFNDMTIEIYDGYRE